MIHTFCLHTLIASFDLLALRFDGCQQQALLDYECGYVKEGVGAGGLAWLTQLAGLDPQALAAACDQACGQLLMVEP